MGAGGIGKARKKVFKEKKPKKRLYLRSKARRVFEIYNSGGVRSWPM